MFHSGGGDLMKPAGFDSGTRWIEIVDPWTDGRISAPSSALDRHSVRRDLCRNWLQENESFTMKRISIKSNR